MGTSKITKDTTKKMASLSGLSFDEKEESYFTKQFNQTLEIIDKFNMLNTKNVQGTDQVTGLRNVFREDKLEPERTLTQEEALSNAKNKHDGYFLVKAIFDE